MAHMRQLAMLVGLTAAVWLAFSFIHALFVLALRCATMPACANIP